MDVILEDRSGELAGVEVKASATVNPGDFKGLQLLADSLPGKFKRGIVLYTGNQFLAFGENLFAVPVQALWK